MKVIRSKTTGYCLGVSKTIENASKALKLSKKLGVPAYSIGALIHNIDIVSGFERQGLSVIKSPDVVPGVALVRAHGITQNLEDEFKSKGFTLIDSTCSQIAATKNKIKKSVEQGRFIVAIGIKNHAELKTLAGVCPEKTVSISDLESIDCFCNSLSDNCGISVAVQTTFPEELFIKIRAVLKSRFHDIIFLNKLCPICKERKYNALNLAEQCDAVVVVGSKTSANTTELADYIRNKSGKPVFMADNESSLTAEFDSTLKQYGTLGVCTGTSTPDVIFNAVCAHLENI